MGTPKQDPPPHVKKQLRGGTPWHLVVDGQLRLRTLPSFALASGSGRHDSYGIHQDARCYGGLNNYQYHGPTFLT